MKPLSPLDPEALRNVDIRTVDPAALADIRDVNIDVTLAVSEKMIYYLKQIGNPYCFRHGDVVVKINHSKAPVSIQECMEGFYRSL